ncbi:MAG: sulfatase [Verrucomicrobiota bacterium]
MRSKPLPLSLLALSVVFPLFGDKPDILVYLSDDHSQFDSSLYGAADIPTPNFEKLAAQGMHFTHAYVASPSCAPSRAAMLTGLFPARNGAEGNHTYPHPGTRSLIANLKDVGYEVVAIGKVSHGNNHNLKFDYGFDLKKPAHSIETLRKEVIQYLDTVKRDKPICLFVGTTNPHVPWPERTTFDPSVLKLPPDYIDTPATRRFRARYYQEIHELDAFLGELLELKNRYLGDNTLFIHTSDHGSQVPFGKWTLYDYGTRVPFIVAWQNRIQAKTKSKAFISWVDLLPTLIDAAGGEIPSGIDGRSFLPILTGEAIEHRKRIFTTHTSDKSMNLYPSRAIRTPDWKLIHNLHPEFAFTTHSDLLRRDHCCEYWTEWIEYGKQDPKAQAIIDRYYQRPEFELYKVEEDPYETNNLAEDPAYADIVKQLKSQLDAWRESQNDNGRYAAPPHPIDKPETWHPNFHQHRLAQRTAK